MAELKIENLIGKDEIKHLEELDSKLQTIKATYADVAGELAKGLRINVEVAGDLNKLNAVVSVQSKRAQEATMELNEALKQQSELTQRVARSLDEQVKSGTLSIAEIKKVTDASTRNAAALEKVAKAEAALEKAQGSSNNARKKAVLSEEERIRVISEAVSLSNKEIHSKEEAKNANKELQRAVNLLKDTDENYLSTIKKLNSSIDANTDYIKKNSDRYTRQKMTIGDYTVSVKRAWMEIQKGNSVMKNMGTIAKSTGGLLGSSFNTGLKQVSVSVGSMIKGMLGAQAVIKVILGLCNSFKQGIRTAMDFEAANSKLAAILGTTADKTKELQIDARALGSTTKYTAAEATNLQIELAKLGFTSKEILQSTKFILRFAQATGSELPEAAALAGAALRMFGAETTETERYVSTMAVSTSRSALSFSYLATALPIVGPVAKSFNFTIEDTLSLLGKLADSGFNASMAATATRNIFLNLADSGGKLAKALGKPVNTLPELIEGLLSLREKGVDLNTTLELTDKRSVAAFNAFLTSADKIIPLREQITGVSKELEDMAGEMSNNTSGAVKTLSSAWEELMISIYGNTGAIRAVVEAATEAVKWLTNLVQSEQTLFDKLNNVAKSEGVSIADNEYKESEIAAVNQIADAYVAMGKKKSEAIEQSKNDRISAIDAEIAEEKKHNEKVTKLYKERQDAIDKGYVKKKYAEKFRNDVLDSEKKLAELERRKSIVEAIPVVDETSVNSELTDEQKKALEKQKKAAEKAAKERLKIQQNLEQSRYDLMDEGLEKELAKISLGFAKKIAAIRGDSKEEQETRENLTKQMQDSLNEYELNYYVNAKKQDLNNRLAAVEEGSRDELDLRLELLQYQQWQEEDAAEKTGASVVGIQNKYKKKREEMIKDFDLKGIEAQYSKELSLLETNAIKEENILTEKRNKGEISERDYQIGLFNIKQKYARLSLELAIKQAKVELEASRGKVSNADIERMQGEIDKLEAQLKSLNIDPFDEETKQWSDSFMDALDNMTDASQEYLDGIEGIFGGVMDIMKDFVQKKGEMGKDFSFADFWKSLDPKDKAAYILNAYAKLFEGITAMMSKIYDARIEGIEKEQEANEKAGEEEIERIELLESDQVISKEEAEARKRASEDKTEKQNEELAKKKAALQEKQARWDKANAITQSIIATSLAVIQALPNFFIAALVGAMGLIQTGIIAAQPIPKYAKGTGDRPHEGGYALVGDGGKQEVAMYDGKIWVTPDTPTLVDLPKGTTVFPDMDSLSSADLEFSILPFVRFSSDNNRTVVVNDYSALEKKMERNNYLLEQSIKQQHRDAYDREFEFYKMRKK